MTLNPWNSGPNLAQKYYEICNFSRLEENKRNEIEKIAQEEFSLLEKDKSKNRTNILLTSRDFQQFISSATSNTNEILKLFRNVYKAPQNPPQNSLDEWISIEIERVLSPLPTKPDP